MKCSKCNVEMKKIGKMESGNSIFIEYQCPNCGKKEMRADGLV